MGSKRDSSSEQNITRTQQVTPQPLPEQREQIKLALDRQRAAQPGVLALDQALLGQLLPLARGEGLQGDFATLGRGIPDEVNQELVNRSLDAITPRLEAFGILDSGVTSELAQRASTDIFLQSELEKIRQQENLVNVLQGFPATVNQPILQTGNTLAAQLAGLTPVNTSGNFFGSSQTFGPSFGRTFGQNFASSLGQGAGAGINRNIFGG